MSPPKNRQRFVRALGLLPSKPLGVLALGAEALKRRCSEGGKRPVNMVVDGWWKTITFRGVWWKTSKKAVNRDGYDGSGWIPLDMVWICLDSVCRENTSLTARSS